MTARSTARRPTVRPTPPAATQTQARRAGDGDATAPASAMPGAPAAPEAPEAPATAEPPDLDDSQVASLAEVLPPEDLLPLIGEFLAGLETRVAALDRCAAAADFAQLGREAHALAGVAGNFGAERVMSYARLLESACLSGNRNVALDLVTVIKPAAARAMGAVRQRFPAARPEAAA